MIFVYSDIKPDNVFLKAWWESEGEQRPYLDLVSLGDMDDSFMIPDDMTCDYELGNVRWRSPEGQLAKRINRPSEVFSFGLFVGPRNMIL